MKKVTIIGAALALLATACGGHASKSAEGESATMTQAEFAATQPIESGQYRAVRYDIEGPNARKGMFDGRLLVSLGQEQSGMYVYENGNRAKINYKIVLKTPFEAADSGRYRAEDVNGLPVVLTPDSAMWTLGFNKGENAVNILFEAEPMQTGTPLEMMERIATAIKNNQ